MQSTYLPFCSVERLVASTTPRIGPSPIEALRLPGREVENAPIISHCYEAILRMPVDSELQSEYNQELRSLIDDLKSQPLCVLRELRRIGCEGQENPQNIDERRKLHHFLDREVLTSIAEECFKCAGLPFENKKSALVDFKEEDGSGTWTLINGEHAICISVSSDNDNNDTAELVRINPITFTARELVYPTYPKEGSSLQEVATSSKTYTRKDLEAILQSNGNIVSEPERYSGARLVGGKLGAIAVGFGADSDMECQIIRNSTERDEHLSFHLNDDSLLKAACSEEEKVVSGTVDGPCISLCGLGANNIYHWFNDILPQLIRAEDMYYPGKYIIPEGPPYVEESLRLLNIPEERLHRFSSGVLAVQGELLVLDRIQAKEPGSPYSDLMHTLRTRIEGQLESAVSDDLKNQIAELTQDGERPLKLHIVRRPNGNMENARFPTNYEALEVTLGNEGFIAVDMAKLKLADQIYIASKADVLAGPHGAGFTHCMWLKPGAQIIEFFGDSYHLDCFEDLAKVFDLKYASVTGPASEYGGSDHRPFHVPIDKVKLIRDLAVTDAPREIVKEEAFWPPIGQGFQYTVYGSRDRVLKIPLSVDQVCVKFRALCGINEPNRVEVESERATGLEVVLEVKNRLEDGRFPRELAANPSIGADSSIEQDRVTPLREVFEASSIEQQIKLIDLYIATASELTRYGTYETGFALLDNFGLNSQGKVVVLDFGEFTFELDRARSSVEQQPWLIDRGGCKEFSGQVLEHYSRAMDAAFNPDKLQESWPATA